MTDPIDDVAFLARSENRLGIMQTLDERPADRRRLAEETDTPRSTLGRTLGELEEKGWIERGGHEYEVTTAGSLILEQFVPLIEALTVYHTLGDSIELLPFEDTDLEVEHLADAEFFEPTELDPTAPFEYGVEQLRGAETFRCVAQTAPPQYVRAIHEGVSTGRLAAECVLDSTYLDKLQGKPELMERWCDIAGGTSLVRRSQKRIPFVLLVLDSTVHLWLCDEGGETRGIVESEHPTVLSWANDTVDEHLERAQPAEPRLCAPGT